MNIFKINKTIVYAIIGILIITFHGYILDKKILSWIVGISTLVIAVEGLIYDIYYKKYHTDRNHIGSEIFKICVSILILTVFKNDLDMICICWAIIVALTSTRSLNKAIHAMVSKKPFVFEMIFSIIELTLTILLVTNPDHHVSTHVILLGVELIVESIMIVIHMLLKKKEHAIEEI